MHKSPAFSAVTAAVIALFLIAPAGPASAASVAGTGIGYWEALTDGGVFAAGSALRIGGVGNLRAPIVGIAAQPGGKGYILAGADGGVFTLGTAKFFGSMGRTRLTRRVVGVAYSPTGNGYYLVAADGGVFTFGDAVFRGSTGAIALHAPIVGMAVTPTGKGYWLVAADGGVFTFGDAKFHGSAAAVHRAAPVVGMAPTRDGAGYRLAGRDGAIYAFGDAALLPPTSLPVQAPLSAIATSASGNGYLVMGKFGEVAAFGDAPSCNVWTGSTRTRQTGSGSLNTIGIAIPFAAASQGSFLAGSCGSASPAFGPTTPWRVDITRASHGSGFCEVAVRSAVPPGPPTDPGLDVLQVEVPGRLQMRSTQMAGARAVRIYAGACVAIARPGPGGTQSLPFGILHGGDTLPFTSARPITIDTPRTKAFCRLEVFRDADGTIVYNHNGPESHVVVAPGTYYVRSEPLCPVHVR